MGFLVKIISLLFLFYKKKVSPFDIMINGSFHQHGIQKGIKYMNK